MRIRIALLLALALVGFVAGLALAGLSRSPTKTLVAPIEVEADGDERGDREGKKDRGRKDDGGPDDGADAVSGPTAVPAGDDDDDDDGDNSGHGNGDDDDDDNSGPGSADDDKDDDNSGPGSDDDGPDDD